MEFSKWIKVSEQLPPEPEWVRPQHYLATVVNNQVVAVDYVKVNVRKQEIVRWEWNGRICPWEIIAWMPYPEPYKEISMNV